MAYYQEYDGDEGFLNHGGQNEPRSYGFGKYEEEGRPPIPLITIDLRTQDGDFLWTLRVKNATQEDEWGVQDFVDWGAACARFDQLIYALSYSRIHLLQKTREYRKIDTTGRISIPPAMQKYLGVAPGDQLILRYDNDNQALIVERPK